jgi:glycosyltransferase involved in cell wall biosynthesis
MYVKATREVGPVNLLAAFNYSPNFFGRSGDGFYVEGGADWKTGVWDLTLGGRIGYQWIQRNAVFGTPGTPKGFRAPLQAAFVLGALATGATAQAARVTIDGHVVPDADFLDGPPHPDDACRIHTANAALMLELAACDVALCPTGFQRDQFPAPFRDRLRVLHDGIDTRRIAPAPGTSMVLPGLDLSGAREIVTYATRGMEAYRGFPQFMRAAADLMDGRPDLHVVVGGTDRTFYGPRRADGRSWATAMRDELGGRDLSRIHFVGPLAPESWVRLLRATTVHVYLTVPFVLSWSLIEAMAAGCCIVGSDTGPVREVIEDGVHGLLADMRSPGLLADTIATALDDAPLRASLGRRARDRAVDRYALADLLPRHLDLVRSIADRTGSNNIEIHSNVE